jgi:ribonuclease HI
MMAASESNHTKNPKFIKIWQLIDKQKGNLTLCWVIRHAGITGNEEADKEAKRALEENRSRTMKSTDDGLRRKWRAAEKEDGKRGKMQ